MTPRPCVLIPTYNNPRTLAGVVRGAAVHGPVVVVDDGSTDATPAILDGLRAAIEDLTVLTHERNRGKGSALATGLEYAHGVGYTHAITIDSDGQHLPEDIPVFLEAMARDPSMLWLGHRDLQANGAGPGSRFGRRFSNFWTWVQTGHRVSDSQTGFRCYPLENISKLYLGSLSYDFEIEVMVKASWVGVAIDSVPVRVRYFTGAERVSHMQPVHEFIRISWLHTKLCTIRCCFPRPYLALRSLRRFKELPIREKFKQSLFELFVREPGSPQRIAKSVGLGLFLGIAPIWGFQIATAILLSHLLKASKTITVIASNISFPLMIPPILYGALVLGRMAFGGHPDTGSYYSVTTSKSDIWLCVLGSFILATIVATVGWLLTYFLVATYQRLKNRKTIA